MPPQDVHERFIQNKRAEAKATRRLTTQDVSEPSASPSPERVTSTSENTSGLHNKRPYTAAVSDNKSLPPLQALNLDNTPSETRSSLAEHATEGDTIISDAPRKRPAIHRISAGSASPTREPSGSPISRDTQRLWNPDQDPIPARPSHHQSNVARPRQQASAGRSAWSSPPSQNLQAVSFRPSPHNVHAAQSNQSPTPIILGSRAMTSQQPPRKSPYNMELEPETKPILQNQLIAETKGIYAGLLMIEQKCIEVDSKQAASASESGTQPTINNEQFQALIILHRALLHEHHDFFLASQHPSAGPALKRLALKYAMPARMWRHGIHSFLELLRHRLPASLDHMLAFIYLAYSMIALLYETVPEFEDTWVECLGDLGRYRMAIEDDDIKDKNTWTGQSRYWYSKASDKAPATGRLYHHLAILARPDALQQLCFYGKALVAGIPFNSAAESILTLFEPLLASSEDKVQSQSRLPPLDNAFVTAHAILFVHKEYNRFEGVVADFLELLPNHIKKFSQKYKKHGCYISISNSNAMLGYGSKTNPLIKAMDKVDDQNSDDDASSLSTFQSAQSLNNQTILINLERGNDLNTLPFLHSTLVFQERMSRYPSAMTRLQDTFPWQQLSHQLNTLLTEGTPDVKTSPSFPLPEKDNAFPLPEDYLLRGLRWCDDYFPEDWFSNEKIDEEEKYLERPSMAQQRIERILWLACRISRNGNWITYDAEKRNFFVGVTGV